jgi:Flp pilus assembly protein TadD
MVFAALLAVRAAAAEGAYQGTLIEVVDRLSAAHPELIVGLDPALLHQQGGKPVQFTARTDWQADLKTALLPLNLTTLTMKQYPDVLVTSPGALMVFMAQQGLENGQFAQATQQFQAALKGEPDNPQVQALMQFAGDLAPLYAEVTKREAALDKALKEKATIEALGNRLTRYDESWTAMWECFWQDYQRAAQRGLQTELAPLFTFAARQCDRYTELLAQARRRANDLVSEETMAEIKQIQRELSSARLTIEGQVKKSQLYLAQGEKLYAEKKYDQALLVFAQAYDLTPGDLRARTYLGWLQARARRDRRAEEDAYLAKLAKTPDRADLLLALRRHADWVASGPAPRQGALLLALLERGDLRLPLDEALLSRLRSLAATRPPAAQTGQVDGLVTQGGE